MAISAGTNSIGLQYAERKKMNYRNRIKLIPRNNWDYGIKAFIDSLVGISRDNTQGGEIENVFHEKPIWTNSGRVSLYAILKSLELPPGSKVGVPLYCCSVVFNAICQAGLSPCFIDSNLNDFNLSIEDLRRKRAGLAAIIAVHMFGSPCDIDAINSIAGAVPVIEDCAQSFFSTYKGKQTGFLSTASFFSFRCGKYISAGEGSAIFCREPALRNKIAHAVNSYRSLSAFQAVFDSLLTLVKATLYNRPLYGLIGHPVGMRLDKKLNLTAKEGFETGRIASPYAALVNQRIPGFQQKINIQREHAQMLSQSLVPHDFILPMEGKDCSSNWFQYALRFQNKNQRDAMAAYLLNQGIDTSKYLDNITDEARSKYGYTGDCPNAERLSESVLLVPIHYTLHNDDMVHIARAINAGSTKT